MKKHIFKIVTIPVFFVGLSVMLYPTASNAWNSHVQSRVITEYKSAASDMGDSNGADELAMAEEYNQRLNQLASPLEKPQQIGGYQDTLNISGTEIMGYLTIEKIDVELPIYHGTDEAVLNVAIGHLEGTSLPIGGENCHSVLAGHRGLPSARLFTDLDKLEIGDKFTVTVLDRELIYQVDQISVVEPWQVDLLYTIDGGDYCTLMTCTPYGINSHRLLIRGTRTSAEKPLPLAINSNAKMVNPRIATPLYATPLMLAAALLKALKSRKKFTHKGEPKYA